MAWSYRRRIKVIPGVHLNFSKSGISTSIGVKGASLTLGKKGAYLNSSVPGLGIYNRQRLSDSNQDSFNPPPEYDYRPGDTLNPNSGEPIGNIFSADPQQITSQDMQGVKEAILTAHQQRLDLANDLQDVKRSLKRSKNKLKLSYILLYGLIMKSSSKKIKADILSQEEAISQIQYQIDNSVLKLDYEFEDEILKQYNYVVESFKKLCTSNRIWDVTSAHDQDRVAKRSAASKVVDKREVRLSTKEIPDIKANCQPLYFQNGNGADLYFYPNFIIVYSTKAKFAIIGLHELNINFTSVRFVQEGGVPTDSKIIDKTWAKVNKNGSPDKRFKDNYEIPIVRYANISLKTITGLNEEYEFSNYEYAEGFSIAFLQYQNAIVPLIKN